jgi:hypothetical protein
MSTNPSAALAEAVARTSGRFEWLDRERRWFWYIPERDDNSNCLVDQIKRVLAVTPRISLFELRSSIHRFDRQSEELAPPLNVLSSVCERLLFVRFEGDVAVRVAGRVKWEAVLASPRISPSWNRSGEPHAAAQRTGMTR